jgi:hypothetical protein
MRVKQNNPGHFFMKTNLSRRNFLKAGGAFLLAFRIDPSPYVITVNGKIPATSMGTTLIHEHFPG